MSEPTLSTVTVHDAVLEYLEVLERRVMRSQLSAATLHAYHRDLTDFTTLLGPGTVLDTIEADHLEAALTAIAKAPDRRYTRGLKIAEDGSTPPGRGQHLLARWFAAVRGLFRWAADKGYVQVDPTTRVAAPRTPRRAVGARLGLRVDEALLLRASPSRRAQEALRADQKLSVRRRGDPRLLVESGPRVSELCGANRSDIRLHGGPASPGSACTRRAARTATCRCRRRPSGPSRDTVRGASATSAADVPGPRGADQVEDAASALFVSVRGKWLSPRDLQRMVERYTKQYLGRRATPHSRGTRP